MMFWLFESRLNKIGESLEGFKQSCLLNSNYSLLTLQSDRKRRRIQESLLLIDFELYCLNGMDTENERAFCGLMYSWSFTS